MFCAGSEFQVPPFAYDMQPDKPWPERQGQVDFSEAERLAKLKKKQEEEEAAAAEGAASGAATTTTTTTVTTTTAGGGGDTTTTTTVTTTTALQGYISRFDVARVACCMRGR